jgi:hypothetical protein
MYYRSKHKNTGPRQKYYLDPVDLMIYWWRWFSSDQPVSYCPFGRVLISLPALVIPENSSVTETK